MKAQKNTIFKNSMLLGLIQWLTPVLPTTWEVEIGRIPD
jgi:hypothetical protein